MSKAIKINPQDNMIVALENLRKGETIKVEEQQITLKEDIQQKHKFTQESLKKGDPLIMYGVKVGVANQEVPNGAALTTKNMDNAFNEDISFENAGKSKTKTPSKMKGSLWVTPGKMEQQEPKTFGFFFLWFFAKTETSNYSRLSLNENSIPTNYSNIRIFLEI